MKSYFMIVALLFVMQEVEGQIPKINLRDSTLFKAIDSYRQSIKLPSDQYGFFLIELRVNDCLLCPIISQGDYQRQDLNNLTEPIISYSIRVGFTPSISGLEGSLLPDFYTVYGDRPILFYTGMNFLTNHSKKEIRELFKSLEKYSSGRRNFNLAPASIEYLVTGKSFSPKG